jgi:hypothetical protein
MQGELIGHGGPIAILLTAVTLALPVKESNKLEDVEAGLVHENSHVRPHPTHRAALIHVVRDYARHQAYERSRRVRYIPRTGAPSALGGTRPKHLYRPCC